MRGFLLILSVTAPSIKQKPASFREFHRFSCAIYRIIEYLPQLVLLEHPFDRSNQSPSAKTTHAPASAEINFSGLGSISLIPNDCILAILMSRSAKKTGPVATSV